MREILHMPAGEGPREMREILHMPAGEGPREMREILHMPAANVCCQAIAVALGKHLLVRAAVSQEAQDQAMLPAPSQPAPAWAA
jgi:hypothetical protein